MYAPGFQGQGQFATNPPPRPAALRVKLTNRERGLYSSLFQRADPESTGKVEGRVAAEFFRKSALPVDVLREVWNLSVPNGEAFLDRDRFYVAMRLIALGQQGKPVTPESIVNNVEVDLPQFTFQSAVPETAESFEMSADDKVKFESIFNNNSGGRSSLTGLEARTLFERTGVGYEDLARIWGMADPRDTGQLTRNQFIVAMQLIVKVKQRVRLPDVLPACLQAILAAPAAAQQPPAPKSEPFAEFQAFSAGPPAPTGFGVNPPPPQGFGMIPPASQPGLASFGTNPSPQAGFVVNPAIPSYPANFSNNSAFATSPPAPVNPPAKKPVPDPPKRAEAFDSFGDSAFNPPPKPSQDPPFAKPAAREAPSFAEPLEMAPPKRKPEAKKEPAFGFEDPPMQPEPRAKAANLSAEDPIIKELLKTIRTLEARMEDLTDQLTEMKADSTQTRDALKRVEDVAKDGKKQQDQTLAGVEAVLKEVRASRQSSLDSTEQAKALHSQIAESAAAMAGFKSQCEETLKQHTMVSMSIQAFFQQIATLQARGQPGKPQQSVPEVPRQEPPKQVEQRPPPPPEPVRQPPPQLSDSRPQMEPMRAERQPAAPLRVEEAKQSSGKQSPFATGNVDVGFDVSQARAKPPNPSDFAVEEPRSKASSGFDFGLPEQKPRNAAPPKNFGFDELEPKPRSAAPPKDFGFDEPEQRPINAAPPKNFGFDEPEQKPRSAAPPKNFGFDESEQKPRNAGPPKNFGFDEPFKPPVKSKNGDFDFESPPKDPKSGFDFDF